MPTLVNMETAFLDKLKAAHHATNDIDALTIAEIEGVVLTPVMNQASTPRQTGQSAVITLVDGQPWQFAGAQTFEHTTLDQLILDTVAKTTDGVVFTSDKTKLVVSTHDYGTDHSWLDADVPVFMRVDGLTGTLATDTPLITTALSERTGYDFGTAGVIPVTESVGSVSVTGMVHFDITAIADLATASTEAWYKHDKYAHGYQVIFAGGLIAGKVIVLSDVPVAPVIQLAAKDLGVVLDKVTP